MSHRTVRRQCPKTVQNSGGLKVKRLFLISATLITCVGAAQAGIVLQAAHMVGVDGNGSYNSTGIWTTNATDPCCASMNVSEGASFTNFTFPATLTNGTLH